MKKYRIKTRNWNGSKLAHALLTISPHYWDAPDLDIKCYLETKSWLKAWSLWACWMLLGRLTGGWTYIVRPGKELLHGYKSIY